MNRKFLFKLLGSIIALVIIPGQAFAGTMELDSFTDQTTDPINLPATKVLMASLGTSSDKGGDDATATAVTIGGSVSSADVVEVCADYDAVQVSCTTISGSLTNVSIDLTQITTKGGKVFDYSVTLNSQLAAKQYN